MIALRLSEPQINTILKALQESVVIRAALNQPADISLHETIAAIGRQAMEANAQPPQPEATPSPR